MVRILVVLSLCLSSLLLSGQQEYLNVDRQKLSEVLKLIESKNEVSFSYKNQNVESYKISYDGGTYTVNEILKEIFHQTKLDYQYIDDKHIVITSAKVKDVAFCGYLIDADTDEPIPFATIANTTMDNGTTSDEKGYFKFILSESDNHLTCSFLGCEDLVIPITKKNLEECHTYALKKSSYVFKTITVTEYLDDGISMSDDANNIIMQPTKMSVLPGEVEADFVAALQFLPGITSPSETLDGMHVRGGTPDQNLLLWDDIPIYHSSHMYGAITGFNPFVVQSVNIYRNGVPSRYGGRVSSVVDIKSKDEIPDEVRIGLGFNMTQTHAELEAPIGKKSAIFLSGRFSTTESWKTPTFFSYAEKVFQGSKVDIDSFQNIENYVRFNDVTAKWIYKGKKNDFTFSTLGSLNNVVYTTGLPENNAFSLDELRSRHGGAKLGWNRRWNDNIESEFMSSTTTFSNDYGLSFWPENDTVTVAPISRQIKNDLVESNARLGLKWKLTPITNLRFGIQHTEDRIEYSIKNKLFQDTSSFSELFRNRLEASYFDYTVLMPDLIKMDIGLRYQKSPLLNNSYFEPRISVTIDVTENLKLKLSTSKNFQFVSQLVVFNNINDLGLGNRIWVTANNTTIPVIEANQWTGGLLYNKKGWTIDLDAYVKEMTGLTSLSDSFDPAVNVPYSIGTARISGIDVLVKKRFGRYRSWLSYSLSKATYEFLSLAPEAFPATFDQKHVIQWVHLYKYDRWSFSLGVTTKSGLPFTKALDVVNGDIVYGALNAERLLPYHRIDGSVVYQISRSERFQSFVSFSIQNMLNHKNLLARNYINSSDNQMSTSRIVTIDKLGLGFTPNLSMNIRW